jgi:phosphoribosylglycinamide formyltransferase-1
MAAADSRRIAFLCSGGGGNLRFLHEATVRGWLPGAEICAVLADRECAAIDSARTAAIPARVVDFQAPGQPELLQALQESAPDLVVTTVHRILREPVVAAYRGRLLNLHYSLLPAFGGAIGARPVQSALDYGARFTGVTAHEVDETLDGGRPVVQVVIPADPGEALEGLMNVVFRCGCLALLAAVRERLEGQGVPARRTATVLGRPCQFSGDFGLTAAAVADEALWARVAGA